MKSPSQMLLIRTRARVPLGPLLACVLAFCWGGAGCSEVTELLPEEATALTPEEVGFEEGNGTLEEPDVPRVCEDGTACDGGICLPGPDGIETCALGCTADCPDGSICKLVAYDGEFPKPYCVDVQALLCNPCLTDGECNLSVDAHFNRCVRHGSSGSFCASNCGTTGTSCPAGYGCQEVEGLDGVKSEQCLPISGQCMCSGYAVENELSTSCAVENEHGSCPGSRQCTVQGLTHCQSAVPMPESCNALDDDCDGYIDEGVTSPCGGCATNCELEFEPKGAVKMGASQNPYGGALADIVTNDLPFIWIANSNESTVSRLNTKTGCEEARYYVCNNPSRTAVDQDGSGFVACRGGGNVAKYAVKESLCIDKNGNGIIDTSTDLNGDCQISSNEMFTDDECKLWEVSIPGGSMARAAGIDNQGHAWVGDWNSRVLTRLNGETGEVMTAHSISAAPYGLAIDADQMIWVASRSPQGLTLVHPELGEVGTWNSPTGAAYGLAVDPWGYPWMAGGESGQMGVCRFDKDTHEWTIFGSPSHGMSRGIAIKVIYDEFMGVAGAKVYVAHSRYIDVVDAKTLTAESTIDLGSERGAVGVAMDLEGYLWSVDQNTSTATKIDTKTNTIVGHYPVGSGPYTYSDMTGYAFNTITSVQGVHRKVFEGWEGFDTVWDSVAVDATLPGDGTTSHIVIGYRVGGTVDELKNAEWISPDLIFPPASFPHPVDLQGRYFEVKIHLITLVPTDKPKLNKVSVQAHKL